MRPLAHPWQPNLRVKTGAKLGNVTKANGATLDGYGVEVGPMCFEGERLLVLSQLGIPEYEISQP